MDWQGGFCPGLAMRQQKPARPDTLPDADHSFDSKSRLVLAIFIPVPKIHGCFPWLIILMVVFPCFPWVFPGKSYIMILCEGPKNGILDSYRPFRTPNEA